MEVKINRLESIIANLKLKELEIVEKISNNLCHNSKILRTLISPNNHNFIAVNGDWEEVLGYSESDCRGNDWSMIMPEYEISRGIRLINKVKKFPSIFFEYKLDILTKGGKILKSVWRTKYYTDLNMVISIGTII